MSLYDRLHFGMIRFVHETLYGLFVDPFEVLEAAGFREGQRVLEVGCGPGFFTMPAAEIVGETGFVCAIDTNEFAVKAVTKKVEKKGVRNIEVALADVSDMDAPDESFDLVFLFGVIHSIDDVEGAMREIHRVLGLGGLLSVQTSRIPREALLESVTGTGFFSFLEESNGVFRFQKTS
jgi:ubiquinone/menaquinone biosynthesis C-methylase UbiE